jgi:hypothetical protein
MDVSSICGYNAHSYKPALLCACALQIPRSQTTDSIASTMHVSSIGARHETQRKLHSPVVSRFMLHAFSFHFLRSVLNGAKFITEMI